MRRRRQALEGVRRSVLDRGASLVEEAEDGREEEDSRLSYRYDQVVCRDVLRSLMGGTVWTRRRRREMPSRPSVRNKRCE